MTKDEIADVEKYLSLSLTDYLIEYEYGSVDIFESNEEIFMNAINLLEGKKIIYNKSPWKNSKSVIYNKDLEVALKNLIESDEDRTTIEYSIYLLKVLNIIKKYAIIE